jgi:hypothetical protein
MHATRTRRYPLIARAATIAALCIAATFSFPAAALPVSASLM